MQRDASLVNLLLATRSFPSRAHPNGEERLRVTAEATASSPTPTFSSNCASSDDAIAPGTSNRITTSSPPLSNQRRGGSPPAWVGSGGEANVGSALPTGTTRSWGARAAARAAATVTCGDCGGSSIGAGSGSKAAANGAGVGTGAAGAGGVRPGAASGAGRDSTAAAGAGDSSRTGGCSGSFCCCCGCVGREGGAS